MLGATHNEVNVVGCGCKNTLILDRLIGYIKAFALFWRCRVFSSSVSGQGSINSSANFRRSLNKSKTRSFLCLVGLIVLLSSVCHASTLTGTLVAVLSDTRGHYQIENLPAGQYRLLIRAVGYRTDPRTGVSLTADQHVSFDFSLRKGAVRWNEISFYQAMQLWPAGKGKQLIVANCSICHEFQTRMASVTRDADGWRDRVEYMRTAMHYNLPRLADQDAEDVASYLMSLFGMQHAGN
jgi:hypothetical protein